MQAPSTTWTGCAFASWLNCVVMVVFVMPVVSMRVYLQAEGVFARATIEVPWGELTWADQMMLRGERKILLRQIRTRFGAVPPALEGRIEEADADVLEQLAERMLIAAGVEDLLPQDQ